MKIDIAQSDARITECFEVMRQLRPHLEREAFLPLIRSMQREGYQLAFLEDNGVKAVAGFRIMHMLHAGKVFYVDDLVTDEGSRSRGHGQTLFRWLVMRARAAGCDKFTLDSGTQRVHAHRFYLRERMIIHAFHFAMDLHEPVSAGRGS